MFRCGTKIVPPLCKRRDLAGFGGTWRGLAGFCRILQGFARLCRNWQEIPGFFTLPASLNGTIFDDTVGRAACPRRLVPVFEFFR